MNNFDMQKVINTLKEKRKVFSSEDDLKLEMALTIIDLYRNHNVKIRLEYSPIFASHMHIDILVIIDDTKWIPIELKYKTKKCTVVIDKEIFSLKEQKAYNNNCYYYLKDIERIEYIKEQMEKDCSAIEFQKGYTMMVTNDPHYWENTYIPCTLDGKNIEQQKWNERDFGVEKKKYKSLHLRKNYLIEWKLYSMIGENGEQINDSAASMFQYLLHEIR